MKKPKLKPKRDGGVRSGDIVRRAADRTLLRLNRETVLRSIGPICVEEWRCCRDIIAEEMANLLPNKIKEEISRLRHGIDCAANALTDSILCSGNDAATNTHFVRKLRALLGSPHDQQPNSKP